MPSIERKSLDRIKTREHLFSDAGVFAKQGQELDEKTIKLLARHRVSWVPVISTTYEEEEALKKRGIPQQAFLERKLQEYNDYFFSTKHRLLEKLKSIFTPYNEDDRGFQAQGKKSSSPRISSWRETPVPCTGMISWPAVMPFFLQRISNTSKRDFRAFRPNWKS